jgi:hypothetical protein
MGATRVSGDGTGSPRPSVGEQVVGWTPPRFFRLKRVSLTIAATLASINMWTGCPLFALWIGSQFEGWIGARAPSTGVSMTSVLVVVVVLGALEIALALLVTRASNAYDKLTGRPQARRTTAWLRSLGGERQKAEPGRHGVSAVERVAIISVVLCVLAFELWWLLLPRSALPY